MRPGDVFERDGRIFSFELFEYDSRDKAGAYVAKCLTPKPGEGLWWCFTIDPIDLPRAVTRH